MSNTLNPLEVYQGTIRHNFPQLSEDVTRQLAVMMHEVYLDGYDDALYDNQTILGDLTDRHYPSFPEDTTKTYIKPFKPSKER